MSPDTPDNMMEQLPHYRAKYDAAKKIHVYFIPGFDRDAAADAERRIYYYAIASEVLHEDMLQCLKLGVIPNYAVVVQTGQGEPTPAIKEKIKSYYGFDHDAMAKAS